jgi:membrane fusion protein (multidrug efflux system)
MHNELAKKRMIIMLICLGILFGGIFAYKIFVGFMIKKYMAANSNPVVTVSAMQVDYQTWQPRLTASGSLRAIKGVNVTAQLAGMVQKIYFTPGSNVEENTLLVQLNADDDIALLHSLEASAELAVITYNRDKAQYKVQAVSKETLDTDAANVKNTAAQVAQQAAVVEKKSIRAPFTGRLGISQVNPGQYVNPGGSVVMLQTLDPIYADFYVPQQALAQLKVGMPVTVTSDTYPHKTFTGKITTINPGVEVDTRNVEVEATIANPQLELAPGMFVSVEVTIGEARPFLTLPQTAISFNPYGSVAYIVTETGKDKKGKPILTVKQSFVTTGETRGDQVVILKGLQKGQTVVTSGQLKLKNGSLVEINNAITPSNNPAPKLPNEY